ncbi:hypothetical protein D3OALGA1CA_4407, partial [Olavius algarvensis associated proteobacterium Delta 3]
SLDLDGTDFNINQGFASAGIVDIGNSGVLTLAGAASTAGGAVSVSGDANLAVGITTTDDLIDLNGNVALAEGASVTLDTGAGEGNIEIAGTVNGTTGGAAEGLTLDAGTGNITLNDALGGGAGQELGAITIVSGADVTAQSTIEAASLVQVAGSGTTRLQDNVTTTAAAGVNLTATAIALDGLTIAASGDGVARFNGATVLEGATTVTTTGTGAITFESTVDSVASAGHTLELTGDSGDIVLNGAVGSGVNQELGSLTVNSAANVTSTDEVHTINALTLRNIGGTADFSDEVTATSLIVENTVANVNMTGNGNFIVNAVDFLNTGDLTLGQAGGLQTYAGGLDSTGVGGTVSIAGAIATTNTNLSLPNVTLISNATLDAGSDDISLGDVIIANNATLNLGAGGSGNVSVQSISGETLGGTTSSVNFNVTGVVGVTNGIGSEIDSVTITQSGGTTFGNTVDANTIALTGTTGTISFQGALTAGTLTTASQAYNVEINAGATITNPVTFLNTGTVTLGNEVGDNLAFTGGVIATAPSSKNIAGIITAAGTGVINLGASDTNVTTTTRVGGTSTGQITFGDVTLADGVVLTLGDGAATPINTGAVSGTASGAGSSLTINSGGAVVIGGALSTDIDDVTVTDSGGVVFSGAVGGAGDRIDDIALVDTTGTIEFQDDLYAGDLSAAGSGFGVSFLGGTTDIADQVTLSNTGQVTFGDGGSLTFTGGVTHTAGSNVINGDIRSVNSNIDLDSATTVTGSSQVTAGNGTITLGDTVLSDGVTLTLGDGVGSGDVSVDSLAGTPGAPASDVVFNVGGTADVLGTVGTDIGTLTVSGSGGATFADAVTVSSLDLTATGGALRFQGDVAAATLNTAGNPFNLEFDEDLTVTNAVAFGAFGDLTIGSAGDDVALFNGGVGTQAVTGTIQTSNTRMDIGALALNGNTTLVSGFAPTSVINVGAVTGNTHNLTLDAGFNPSAGITLASVGNVGTFTINDSGFTTISGATSATTVTLTDTTGAVTFDGAVNINTLNTTTQSYSVVFNEGGTVNNDTTFANTGGVTFGNQDTDSISFIGGLDTRNGTTSVAGTVNTNNAAMDIGTLSLADNTVFNTGGGDLGINAITGNGNNLNLDTGTTGDIAITSVAGVGTMTLLSSNSTTISGTTGAVTVDLQLTEGAVTFGDAVTITSGLTTANDGYSVVFSNGGVVAGDTDFINTGGVTFNSADNDTLIFTGGLDTTAGPATARGTVQTVNSQMDIGSLTLSGAATLDTGNAVMNVGDVDGAGNSLTVDGGASGAITVSSLANVDTFTVTDSASMTVTGTASATTTSIVDTTGSVNFNGPVTFNTLNTSPSGYSMTFNDGGTVTGDTNFANTGGVVLGDANTDSITFANGLGITTGSTSVAGTVSTSNAAMDIDTLSLADDAELNTGGGDLGIGAITGNGNNLNLDAGTTGDVTISLPATSVGNMALRNSASTTIDGAITAARVDIVNGGSVDVNASVSASDGFSSTGSNFENTGAPINTTNTAISLSHSGTVTLGANMNSGNGTVTLGGGGTYVGTATVTGNRVSIQAATMGLDSVSGPTMDVENVFAEFASEIGGQSGLMTASPKLVAAPAIPPDQIIAPGLVQILGKATFSPAEQQQLEGLSALSTLAVQQEKLEKQLRESAQAQFFMSPPLEIYIDIEAEEEPQEGELPEEPLESLEDDFSRLEKRIVEPLDLLERGPRMPTLLTPAPGDEKLFGNQHDRRLSWEPGDRSDRLDASVAALSE